MVIAPGIWTDKYYGFHGKGGSSLDNAQQDGLVFTYDTRSGDGEIITKIRQFDNNPGVKTYGGPMIRESTSSGSRTVFLAQPYEYADSHYITFYHRNVTNSQMYRTGEEKRDRMFDSNYFPYTKLKRTGNTITASVSDDTVFWVEYASHTFTTPLPTNLLWGISYNQRATSDASLIFELYSISGFGLCPESKNCFVTGKKSNCVDKTAYQTCGSNTWGRRVFSNEGTNQVNNYVPTVTTTSTQIQLRSRLQNNYASNLQDDTFLFAFKEVSGDGIISALVDSFGSANNRDLTSAGVAIRASLTNYDDEGVNIVMCMVPRRNNRVQMRWRPETGQGKFSATTTDGTSANTDYQSGTNKYTVQLIKNGDSITCRHKNTGDPTWITIATKTVPMPSTFYVGLAQNSETVDDQSATFREVSIEGFHGFCSNNGNCTTVGGNLDKCLCDPLWGGAQCDITNCNGKASNDPTVCSSHGQCVGPEQCNCTTGWTGSNCEIPICYGLNASDPNVCFGRGNCTAPDTCSCPPEFYFDCGKSFLYDFFLEVCKEADGCTLNRTAWYMCVIEQAHSCYCSPSNSLINNQNTLVNCDASSLKIKTIRIIGSKLKANLPSIRNLTALETLDISQNEIQFSTFSNLLIAPSLKYLNLSYNNIKNIGEYYDIQTTYFTSFQTLSMEGNAECGVYPFTWLSNFFKVDLKSHERSYWCTSLNLNLCYQLQLQSSKVTVLPHETTFRVNYSTSVTGECQNFYFSQTELFCESFNNTNSMQIAAIYSNQAPQQTFVSCARSGLVSNIDQQLRMVWNYNATLRESISTTIEVVNLPYLKLVEFDRHLFFSNNSGGTLDVTLKYDQNVTRYKKIESDSIKCKIQNDNYFVIGRHVSYDDYSIICSVTLNAPNTGTKEIILYEQNELHDITKSKFNFWIIDLKVQPVNIYATNNIILTDTQGNSLPGLNGYTYQLNNTQFNIKYSCLAPSGSIQNCNQVTQGSYPKDLKIINLEFSDGNVTIHTVEALFYKKNEIQSVLPTAIPIGQQSDVFVTFNASTFETDLDGIQYYCSYESKTVNATVMNTTTIRCNGVVHGVKKYSTIGITFVYGIHSGTINTVNNFYFIGQSLIYPSTSVTNLPGSMKFPFSFDDELKPILHNSLQCQFEDGTIFNAKSTSNYEHECDINSVIARNITFWYINYLGIRTQLSSNYIPMYFINSTVSYDSSSKQFGNTLNTYNASLIFQDQQLPESFKSNVVCSIDNKTSETSYVGSMKYYCSVYSQTAGYGKVSMKLLQVNPFKVSNIRNTFTKKFDITFTNNITSWKKIEWVTDTTKLVSNGIVKNNCADFVVTFKGTEIGRSIQNCNSANTKITFMTQELTTGFVSGYSIYYGNHIAVGNTSFVDGGESLQPYNITEDIRMISISNDLDFGFFKQFNILDLKPFFVLGRTTNVSVTTNYEIVDFKNRIEFYVQSSSNLNFSASLVQTSFISTVQSNSKGKQTFELYLIYTPTGEKVTISSNMFEFFFLDQISMSHLYPFVEGFTTSIKVSHLKINTNDDLLTDKGLLCQYTLNSNTKYSTAKFIDGNTKYVGCNITTTGLDSTSEIVDVTLWMNASTPVQLSSDNLTLPFLKEPIQLQIDNVFNKFLFGQNFNLNFTDPLSSNKKLSYSSFRMKAIPENVAYSKYLECQIGLSKPICFIDVLSFDKTPSIVNFQIEFNSTHFPHTTDLKMTSHYLRENVTILTEFPFIANSMNTSLEINFNVSQSLHENFTFYCRAFDQNYKIVRGNTPSTFSCTFNTQNQLFANISLILNDSSIQGMNGVISNEDSKIELTQLKLNLGYSEDTKNSSHTITRTVDTSTVIIQSKYRNLQYQIISSDAVPYVFSCQVEIIGSINCNKVGFVHPTFDIALLFFTLQYKYPSDTTWKKLIEVNRGLVSFEKHSITAISPIAALVNANLNITITFSSSTLNIDNLLLNNLKITCSDQNNLFNGVKVTSTSHSCDISYKGTQTVQVHSSFQIPDYFGNQNVTISSNTFPFYFLQQSTINLKSENDNRLFLITEHAKLEINITTFIPSSALGFIKGKFNESSGFSGITNLVSSSSNDHMFHLNATVQKGGLYPLSLWYDDGSYQFQLSNNTIDVIFIKISKIIGTSPSVAVVNETSPLDVRTLFDTQFDYGNASFICKYGPEGDVYRNVTKATLKNEKGIFACNVLSDTVGKFFISVWVKSFGVEKKIVDQDFGFRVVTTDFFDPSYGLPSGEQPITMNVYGGLPTNVTFNQTVLEKYLFVCNLTDLKLKCITPQVSSTDVPSFASYPLKFTQSGKPLSVSWVVYEKKNISSYHPRVVSTFSPSFNLEIQTNTLVTIHEGSFHLSFDTDKENEIRYDLDQGLNNTVNASVMVSPLSSGDHIIELFYFNSELVEPRSMIVVSSQEVITVLERSTIAYTSSAENVVYLNQVKNITVNLQNDVKMNAIQKSSVKCKLGNSFVDTFYDVSKPTQYTCSVVSSTRKKDYITLWYKNSDALGGELLISSTSLPVLFIDLAEISQVSPFATITSNTSITIHSDFVDIYGADASYSCDINGKSSPASLTGSQFKCTVTKDLITSYFVYVKMNMSSMLTGYSTVLANNQVENSKLYFLNGIQTNSIFPFLRTHSTLNAPLESTIQLSLQDELLLDRGATCNYISSEGSFYSTASYVSGNKKVLQCKISIQSLTSFDTLNVRLWMNTSISLFQISTNNATYMFIKEPALWKDQKVIAPGVRPSMVLNVPLPPAYEYQVQLKYPSQSITSNVTCDYNGTLPDCTPTFTHLNPINTIPANVNFTVFVTHKHSRIVSSFNTESLTYFRDISFQHLKPAIVSSYETKYASVKMIGNILGNQLNSNEFSFKCNISTTEASQVVDATFDILPSEYQQSLDTKSHFSCKFKSFAGANIDYKMKLLLFIDGQNYEITNTPAVIHSVSSLPIVSSSMGTVIGGFNISINLSFTNPTQFYSNYNYTVMLKNIDRYVSLGACHLESSLLHCSVDSVVNLFSSWTSSRKMLLTLFIDGSRSIALTPYFTFYPQFKLVSISPSRYASTNANGYFHFTVTEFEYFGETIHVKYIMNQTSIEKMCSILSSTIINCPTPSFPNPGEASIHIALTTGKYQNMNKTITVYSPNSITVSEVSPRILSFVDKNSLFIVGSSFIPTNSIKVKIFDNFINRISEGTFVNSTHIRGSIDTLFFYDGLYPRSLKAELSFDGGLKFIANSIQLTIDNWEEVKISPTLISSNQMTTGITVDKFPSEIFYNATEFTLEYYLYLNQSIFVKMNCNYQGILNCNLTKNPTVEGLYEFRVILVDNDGKWNQVNIFAKNKIYVYSLPTIQLMEPKILTIGSNKPIRLKGVFNKEIFKTATFKFVWENALLSLDNTTTIVEGSISETEISVDLPKRTGLQSFEVSFNGLNFHPLNQFESIVENYEIISATNINSKDNYFFTFETVQARIEGKNFLNNTENVKLVLKFGDNIIDITTLSQIQIESSTVASFIFPRFEVLNISYPLRYPVELNVGLSFNGGYDFKYVNIVYLNTHRQATFTGISPTVLPAGIDVSISIFGIYDEYFDRCAFYTPGNVKFGSEVYMINKTQSDKNSTVCMLPGSVTKGLSSLIITILNPQNNINDKQIELKLYEIPILTEFIPNVGVSSGGFPIVIEGINLTKVVDVIYCRFGKILCENTCTFSNSRINCITQSHPPTQVDVEISFNKEHWHGVVDSNSTKFQFTPCLAGYSAQSYRAECSLCPPGTYKQIGGLFDCIPCEPDFYSSFSGAIQCEKCPANTTTNGVKGASSHSQCVCVEEYYMNPDYDAVSGAHQKCIACPSGSICDKKNTTVPVAQEGYWNSADNHQLFYSCLPKKSCGGYAPENCTIGYSGPRCGFCSAGYYRFRRDCNKCEEGAWLRLVGILAAMALVTGVLFLLSSTKVHHIASIAIAFSFWQVLSMFARFDIQWPSLIGGSLTGASTFNFNTDFLSPNCIFPDMTYVSLWTLQMMMPIGFFICFAILYCILLFRSFVATIIGGLLKRGFKLNVKYLGPYKDFDLIEPEDDEAVEEKKSKGEKIKAFLKKVYEKSRYIATEIGRKIINLFIWWFTEASSFREMVKIFNRIINAIFAFISFSFIFIMTTASEVFVCKWQPNGKYTLNNSPDIFCYEGIWWYMFPLTFIWYIIFGGGSFVYFVTIYFKFNEWSKDTNFNERNKFMLSRFRKRYYFWEAVITLRKTILSVLYIFLEPMLVIISGILLLFLGFLLHTNFVPFKRKFHNVMDYFVILTTLSCLFFGLLFFVDRFPNDTTKSLAEYLAFIVLVGSTLVVVSMILWDARTRRKHDAKKNLVLKRHKILDKERDDMRLKVLFDLHQFGKGDFHQHDNMFGNLEVPWDTDFQYKPVNFKTDSESEEDQYTNMNQIFGDLLSKKRFDKNVFSIKKRTYKTGLKIVKSLQKKNKYADGKYEKSLNTYDTIVWDKNDLDKIQNFEKNLGKEIVGMISNSKAGQRFKTFVDPRGLNEPTKYDISRSSSVTHVKSKKLTVKKSVVSEDVPSVTVDLETSKDKRKSEKEDNQRLSMKKQKPSVDIEIETEEKK